MYLSGVEFNLLLENHKTYTVKCTGKIVFCFQDDLSFSRLVLKTKRSVLKTKRSALKTKRPVLKTKRLILKTKRHSVNCTENFVFGFQDKLCSLGLIENQIEFFESKCFLDYCGKCHVDKILPIVLI